jgi:hypothetical protein
MPYVSDPTHREPRDLSRDRSRLPAWSFARQCSPIRAPGGSYAFEWAGAQSVLLALVLQTSASADGTAARWAPRGRLARAPARTSLADRLPPRAALLAPAGSAATPLGLRAALPPILEGRPRGPAALAGHESPSTRGRRRSATIVADAALNRGDQRPAAGPTRAPNRTRHGPRRNFPVVASKDALRFRVTMSPDAVDSVRSASTAPTLDHVLRRRRRRDAPRAGPTAGRRRSSAGGPHA